MILCNSIRAQRLREEYHEHLFGEDGDDPTHYRELERKIIGCLRGKGCEEAVVRDIFQDTLLKIEDGALETYRFDHIGNAGGLDPHLASWMTTIASNIAKDKYKSLERKKTLAYYGVLNSDEGDGTFLDTLVDGDMADFEREVDVKTISGFLWELLGRLPTPGKCAFILYVAGNGYEEVADKLGIPVGTVSSGLHSFRKRVREELGERYSLIEEIVFS